MNNFQTTSRTLKAMGSVLLHLQCVGSNEQRKFGLSVFTNSPGWSEITWRHSITIAYVNSEHTYYGMVCRCTSAMPWSAMRSLPIRAPPPPGSCAPRGSASAIFPPVASEVEGGVYRRPGAGSATKKEYSLSMHLDVLWVSSVCSACIINMKKGVD